MPDRQGPGLHTGYAFIKDTPGADDELGSHQRVADAIAATLFSSPDSRIIGLVGPWGGGKSTIVSLLEKTLSTGAESKVRMYVFDAWTHHGEPVRRAFLEDFHAYCRPSLIDTSNEAFIRRTREVTGRATVTRTQEIPAWTPGGIIVIASLALSAFGLARAHALRHVPGVGGLLALFPNWLPPLLPFLIPAGALLGVAALRAARPVKRTGIAGPLLALAMLASGVWLHAMKTGTGSLPAGLVTLGASIACAAVALWRNTGKRNKTTPGETHEETLLGLVLTRQHQDRRTKVSGMGTPTAVEFSDLFNDMVASLHGGAPLVIVVDNMDRLPPEDARELWSMLRTFFLTTPKAKGPRPVLLVPISEKSVEAMYKDEKALQPSRSFMEKTFDVLFHVPAPIFTHWSAYLARRLTSVFGPRDPAQHAMVTELLDAYIIEEKDNITPRRINALVNLMATYDMQRTGRGISFESLAYYCINKATIDGDLLEAIGKKSPPIAALDPTWQAAVVALHHGVTLDEAIQVVLAGAAERAIDSRNGAELATLMTVGGVSATVPRMVNKLARQEPLSLSSLINVGFTLNDAAPSGDGWTATFTRLVQLIPRTTPWRGLSEQDFADLRTLTTRTDASFDALTSINHAIATVDAIDAVSATGFVEFWKWAETTFGATLEELRIILVPMKPADFVDIAVALLSATHVCPLLAPIDPEGVVGVLTSDLNERTGLKAMQTDQRLIAVMLANPRVDWKPHLVMAVSRLSTFGPGTAVILEETITKLATPLLAVLMHIVRDAGTMEVLEAQHPDVILSRVCELAANIRDWTVLGRAAALLAISNTDLRFVSALSQSIDGAAEQILRDSVAEALYLACRTHPTRFPGQALTRLGAWANGTIGAVVAMGMEAARKELGVEFDGADGNAGKGIE